MHFHDADVHFMTGMINHHAQALVMSGFAPENGASETIRTLCARIINAQKDEINIMQEWLRDRGQEVPEIHIEDGHLMIHGPAHAMHMPGMLTDEQLDELRHARGRDFDRLFLEYMIMHHEGAVTMVLGALRHRWRRPGRLCVQARLRHSGRSGLRDRPHAEDAGGDGWSESVNQSGSVR